MARRKQRERQVARLPEKLAAWMRVHEELDISPQHIWMALKVGIAGEQVEQLATMWESQEHDGDLGEWIETRYRKKYSQRPPSNIPKLENMLVDAHKKVIKKRQKKRQK